MIDSGTVATAIKASKIPDCAKYAQRLANNAAKLKAKESEGKKLLDALKGK